MIGVIGEALIDLVVASDGTISAHLGGGPYNTARALGRLGVPASFLGRLSTDAFGRQLADELASCGVATAVPPTSDATTLALARLDESGKASYQFYLDGTSAPGLTTETLSTCLPHRFDALHVGTLGLVLEPMAAASVAALRANPNVLRFVDPNIRPLVIRDRDTYLRRLDTVLAHCDVVKVSDDDLGWLIPDTDVVTAARAVLAKGPSTVFVTAGPTGTIVVGQGFEQLVPGETVVVADTVGAGDAFSAGVLTWWWEHARASLSGREAAVAAAVFGNRVAARTVERHGAQPPTRSEVVSGDEPGSTAGG